MVLELNLFSLFSWVFHFLFSNCNYSPESYTYNNCILLKGNCNDKRKSINKHKSKPEDKNYKGVKLIRLTKGFGNEAVRQEALSWVLKITLENRKEVGMSYLSHLVFINR